MLKIITSLEKKGTISFFKKKQETPKETSKKGAFYERELL